MELCHVQVKLLELTATNQRQAHNQGRRLRDES